MYYNSDEIEDFCSSGFIKNYDPACVNSASLDIRMADTILLEDGRGGEVDYRARTGMGFNKTKVGPEGILIHPGVFFLTHTMEECNFPDNVAALFRIKSSMGRIGLEHMDAGWVDPGFHGVLTLEFKNMTNNHAIRLRPGDRVGQLVFMQGIPVDPSKSYRNKGHYNGYTSAAGIGYGK